MIYFRRWKFLTHLRDFLLFLPAGQSNLRGVLSYYSATGNVNQEGDVTINDTLQGFGRLCPSLVSFRHIPFCSSSNSFLQ